MGAHHAREHGHVMARTRHGFVARLGARLRTLGRLVAYFAERQRLFLLPLLIVLLVAGVLLLVPWPFVMIGAVGQ